MSKGTTQREQKQKYFEKFSSLLQQNTKIIIVLADNVGSNHFQQIRAAMRGKATIVMGKKYSDEKGHQKLDA